MSLNRFHLPAFLILLSGTIHAASWTLLPVRTVNLTGTEVKSGPELLPGRAANSFELSRAMNNFLAAQNFLSLTPQSDVETLYSELKIDPQGKITREQLLQISARLESDQLLFVTVIATEGGFQMESRIFYGSGGELSNTMADRDTDFWRLVGNHLLKRFNITPVLKSQIAVRKPLLFALDASGGSYRELEALKEAAATLDAGFSAACAADGEGRLSFSSLKEHPAGMRAFLRDLNARGGGKNLINFSSVLDCIRKFKPVSDKADTILLVSAAPESRDRGAVHSQLMKIAAGGNVLILGAEKLSEDDADFWISAAASARIPFRHIVYRQKIGLESGQEWYLFRRGMELIDSREALLPADKTGVAIPASGRSDFSSAAMAAAYERLSRNRVIYRGNVEILLRPILGNFLTPSSVSSVSGGELARVLVESGGVSFWISLPRSSVFNRNGGSRLESEKSYYFLLNLQPGEKGIPFSNSPSFGRIYQDRSEISRLLILEIPRYLRQSGTYLGRSVGGTSLYAVYGRVKLIRMSRPDAMEDEGR